MEDYIPGAVPEVFSGGLTLGPASAIDLTAKLRHFGSAPPIEDDSVRSDPTTPPNLGGYYDMGRLRVGVELFNLLNADDSDITYFHGSQLRAEVAPVEDRHFPPVEPRQLRVSLRTVSVERPRRWPDCLTTATAMGIMIKARSRPDRY